MAQIQLTPAQRKEHRAEAHHLDPVVMIGSDGLTANVQKEIDAALNAQGLIKVRVFNEDRSAREEMKRHVYGANRHVVSARLKGYDDAEREITLEGEERVEVELKLAR